MFVIYQWYVWHTPYLRMEYSEPTFVIFHEYLVYWIYDISRCKLIQHYVYHMPMICLFYGILMIWSYEWNIPNLRWSYFMDIHVIFQVYFVHDDIHLTIIWLIYSHDMASKLLVYVRYISDVWSIWLTGLCCYYPALSLHNGYRGANHDAA